jgi:hypothetical protein
MGKIASKLQVTSQSAQFTRASRKANSFFFNFSRFPIHSLISPNAGEIIFVSLINPRAVVDLTLIFRVHCTCSLGLTNFEKGKYLCLLNRLASNLQIFTLSFLLCFIAGCVFVGTMLTGCSAVLFIMAAIPYWTRLRQCFLEVYANIDKKSLILRLFYLPRQASE